MPASKQWRNDEGGDSDGRDDRATHEDAVGDERVDEKEDGRDRQQADANDEQDDLHA
jgi:hypothetical protein